MALIHYMKLNNSPFNMIKNHSKTIEMRLYDEKRKQIKVNDTIIFINNKTLEILEVLVTNLYIYNDFFELYNNHNKLSIGYNEDEIPNPNDMYEYYSKEDIKKHKVVGIEIKIK